MPVNSFALFNSFKINSSEVATLNFYLYIGELLSAIKPSYTSMFRFNPVYFTLAILLFVIEVLIAMYAHDEIIRPYVGDVLVVMLVYCFVKAFLNTPLLITALATLLFAYTIETLQYFEIVNKLGLQHSKLARTVIGTSFAWMDILAYTLGIAILIGVEMLIASRAGAGNSLQ